MKDDLITFKTIDNDSYSVRVSDIAALRVHQGGMAGTAYHVIVKGVSNFIEININTYQSLYNQIKKDIKRWL